MIDLLLRDSHLRPDIFLWSGPLPISEIEKWEREQSLSAPEDLKRLWSLKGGGDLFDTETILQPFGAPEHDLIGPASQPFWEKGLSTEYCVFHTGLNDSVFRKSDGALFTLKSDPGGMSQFKDLDEWYRVAVREVYAKGYALAPLT
jgi:hypothetical protein